MCVWLGSLEGEKGEVGEMLTDAAGKLQNHQDCLYSQEVA